MTDEQFFQAHPDRKARIRLPGKEPYRDSQRGVRYLDEQELAFRSLGPHDPRRRRMLLWRAPADHPTHPNHLLKIPFLLFADETVSDADATLLPIIHSIMKRSAI
jgi:hypothetical protein